MNIAASDLKHALKKLSPVRTETYRFDVNGIVANDSDVLISVPGPTFDGTFNINGKKLSQVVNRMGGQIEISQIENKLILKSARAVVELEIQPVKSVPLPDPANHSLTLDMAPFKKALATAAASASPAKSAVAGGVVLLQNLPLGIEESDPAGYRITGTDLIVMTIATVKTPINLQFRSLLNLTAAQIVQLMDGDQIEVGDNNKYIVLKSGGTTVYASKPMQKYPDFDKLLAYPAPVKFGLKPEEWLSALRTVEPLIDEVMDSGAVGLHFQDGVVQCKSVGVGSTASDEAGYEQLEPDPIFEPKELTLRINAKYLSGFLSKAGPDATLAQTINPNDPKAVNLPIRLESDNVVVLTMPVREKK